MKPKIIEPGQTDLLQPRLEDFLKTSHPIVLLAGLFDWKAVERDYADHFVYPCRAYLHNLPTTLFDIDKLLIC